MNAFKKWIPFILLIASPAWAGAGSHGGGPYAQEMVARIYEALDLVKEWKAESLSAIHPDEIEKLIPQIYVYSEPHAYDRYDTDQMATADRDTVPKRIKVGELKWKDASWSQQIANAVHEILEIQGLESGDYTISGRFKKELESRKLTAMPAGRDAKQPVLLDQVAYNWEAHGLGNFDDARQICDLNRETHKKDYFFVYCVYLDKSWETLQIVRFPVSDWYLKTSEVYGVGVYGLGKIDEKTPWKTIETSLQPAKGAIPVTFSGETDALYGCNLSILDAKNTFRYYRAKCAAEQVEGRWHWEIQSQNPFL